MTRIPVGQVRDEFISYHRAEGRAAATLSRYTTVLNRLLEFLTAADITMISQIDLSVVDAFRATQKNRNLASNTIAFFLEVTRSFVLFAYRRRHLTSDPLVGLRIGKAKAKPQPCWTWDEVQLIIQRAPTELRPLFTFLAYTGTRIGEALHLQWNDVDFQNGVIHIRAKEGWKPKSGDDRVIPMAGDVVRVVQLLKKEQPWVFSRGVSRLRRPYNFKTCAEMALTGLRATLQELGLPGRLHTFRHAFISHSLIQGTPESVVRSWVGHVDSEIIRRYTHVADPISKSQMRTLFDSSSKVPPDWSSSQ